MSNFHSFETVGRGSETQSVENCYHLFQRFKGQVLLLLFGFAQQCHSSVTAVSQQCHSSVLEH